MIRHSLLAGLLFFCSGLSTNAEATEKPNIIFILIDDMGWRDLGCYGSTFYQTPNIDRLAAHGMKFSDAYAACPVCSPTRASILTGNYPARLHLTDWLPGRTDRPSQKLLRPKFQPFLSLERVTIAEALRPSGYVSASIGKWHLGTEPYFPRQQGFGLNIGGTHAGSPPGGYFRFKTPTLAIEPGQEYLTDRLTEEAEQFIEMNKGNPFFLYLSHYAVHIPLQAKKDVIVEYQANAKHGAVHNNAIYAAMVQSVDDSVGRIMKKLDDLKLAENTVIFFTSDNGGLSVKEGRHTPATSNAPLRAGKGYLYEGGVRVPLIVKSPGARRGVCNIPVSSVDYFPAILELAGVTPQETMDGESLVPLLKGAGRLRPRPLYWHYPHYSNQGGRPGSAIREGDFKLIEFFEDGHLELYNLMDDIGEANNLAQELPERTEALGAKLKAWRKAVNAQLPRPNPEYQEPVDR